MYAAAADYTVTLTASNVSASDSLSEVVSVQPIATGTTVAADSFGRSQNNGWGNADIGGPYTLEGNTANFTVSNGAGSIVVPGAGSNRAAFLNNVNAGELDMEVRIAADKMPAGGAYFAYVEARHNGTSSYRGQLIFEPDGSIRVDGTAVINGTESALGTQVTVPGVTATAGGYIRLRMQVTGSNPTTIRVKAWADGQTEPTGWQFTATDSRAAVQGPGGVGVRAYLAKAVTDAPVTFSFDDLNVTQASAPPPGPIAADTFARTLNSGWGIADTGGAYTLLGAAGNYSIAGGVGSMVIGSAGVSRVARLDSVSATNVDITFRVAVDQVAAGGNDWIYAVARHSGNNEYRPQLILRSNGSVAVSASALAGGTETGLGQTVVAGLTQVPGSFIWVHAQVTGTNPTTINVKAWADGQPEPANWQLTVTDSTSAVQGAGSVGLHSYVSSASKSGAVTFSFDDYSVTDITP